MNTGWIDLNNTQRSYVSVSDFLNVIHLSPLQNCQIAGPHPQAHLPLGLGCGDQQFGSFEVGCGNNYHVKCVTFYHVLLFSAIRAMHVSPNYHFTELVVNYFPSNLYKMRTFLSGCYYLSEITENVKNSPQRPA